MKEQIEVIQKPNEGKNPRYVNKKSFHKKKTFFANAKPKKNARIYKYCSRCKDAHLSSRGLCKYRGNMSKVEFVNEYLKALNKRPDIMPNIYCSRAWLLANDKMLPAINPDGYMSFFNGKDQRYFFLPGYRNEINGKVFFKAREAMANFPLSLGSNEGIRYDIQCMYTRDVSVYMIPKALKIRNTMKNIPYKVYPLLYSDRSKDGMLRVFMDMYKKVHRQGKRRMTEDVEVFEKMLFHCYGQHRFVLERTDVGKILAVLIWEDTGEIINMIDTVGCVEPPQVYGFKRGEWKKYYSTKCLRFPEVILRYEFMKRFPSGTVFNGGGCNFSKAMFFMQVLSQPAHMFDLRTTHSIISPTVNGVIKPKFGMLPGEFFMPVRKLSFWIDCKNKVLFSGAKAQNINAIKDPEQRKRAIRYKKRRAWKFLTLKEYAAKFLKNNNNGA